MGVPGPRPPLVHVASFPSFGGVPPWAEEAVAWGHRLHFALSLKAGHGVMFLHLQLHPARGPQALGPGCLSF